MSDRRVGLWLIGAFGGVGTTAALGLAALKRKRIEPVPVATALPLFDDIDLDDFGDFVLGGHELRKTSYRQSVQELQQRSNIFDRDLTAACLPDLDDWAGNVRPGTVVNAGSTISKLADLREAHHCRTLLEGFERIKSDLLSFNTGDLDVSFGWRPLDLYDATTGEFIDRERATFSGIDLDAGVSKVLPTGGTASLHGSIGYDWNEVAGPDGRTDAWSEAITATWVEPLLRNRGNDLLGDDCDGTDLWLPVTFQWNFFFTKVVGAFFEPGLAVSYWHREWIDDCGGDPCEREGSDLDLAEFVVFVGGRFLFSERAGMTVRIGWPYVSIGGTFLL